MRVLFVINGFYADGNGLSASARRTAGTLRELGVDVRVLSQENSNPDGPQPDYILPGTYIPVFNNLINRQGYSFARADRKIIAKALEWADIVHIEEPFWLQVVTCRLAERMEIPCVGTYHLHPENLFSSVHLGRSLFLNSSTMIFWRNTVFNKCLILQCPTMSVRQRLEKWHFKSELRVISNGMVVDRGKRTEKTKKKHDIFTIISTGRYSVEKDQKTLLKAMQYSVHAGEIKIILAGRGPREAFLKRKAEKLYKKGIIKHPVEFCFCTPEQLKELYLESDLYVHCATVEVEGLGCTEALSMGLVPVIAKGKLTATSQYALSGKSLYNARNARQLASRIDWWFENRDQLNSLSLRYAKLDLEYNIRNCALEIKKMYQDALGPSS